MLDKPIEPLECDAFVEVSCQSEKAGCIALRIVNLLSAYVCYSKYTYVSNSQDCMPFLGCSPSPIPLEKQRAIKKQRRVRLRLQQIFEKQVEYVLYQTNRGAYLIHNGRAETVAKVYEKRGVSPRVMSFNRFLNQLLDKDFVIFLLFFTCICLFPLPFLVNSYLEKRKKAVAQIQEFHYEKPPFSVGELQSIIVKPYSQEEVLLWDPLSDIEFATEVMLHEALVHFEGWRFSQAIREAHRVLELAPENYRALELLRIIVVAMTERGRTSDIDLQTRQLVKTWRHVASKQ